MKKITKKHIVAIFSLTILLVFSYSFLMMSKLSDFSTEVKEDFIEKKLVGKNANEIFKLYGEPQDVECLSDLVYDATMENLKVGDPYCKFIYFTNNSLLNRIGWFPGGGTKIYIDKNATVSRFKEYLE